MATAEESGVRVVPRSAAQHGDVSSTLLARLRMLLATAPSGRLVALLTVMVCAYFVPRGVSWNADTHLFLTASVVDRGALNIDPFARYTGDVAFAHGHYFADKAPGLSLLMLPAYALLKYPLLHGQTYASLYALPPAQRSDFLVRYVLTVLYAAVPTGLLCALLLRFMRRMGVTPWWSAGVALIYGWGTLARAFGGELFSHQLTALLVFAAYFLLYRIRHEELSPRWAVGGGALLGYAIITEYPAVLLASVLCIYALMQGHRRAQMAGWLALGALPPLLLGAVYNTLTFGAPWSIGYGHLAGPQVFREGQAQGVFGVTVPHLDALYQTTIGPYRGILLLSPVLALTVPGFLWLWRRTEWRPEALLWLVLVGLYGVFSISYFQWDGGYSMGPRQFLPALPFLVLPLGEVTRVAHHRAWRAALLVLGCLSVVIVELATAVGPLADPRYASPLIGLVLPRLLGLPADPSHPANASALLHALMASLPWFAAAQLDNNWGMLFGFHGLAQLLPLLFSIVAILLIFWYRAARRATLLHWKQGV